MHNAQRVEVTQRQRDFRGIKSDLLLLEHGLAAQMVENLATVQKIHHQVHFALGLEGKVQSDNEGMLNSAQNVAGERRQHHGPE